MQRFVRGLVAALACLSAFAAIAQSFPAKPVTLIVPWPAGGSTDQVMRALATATEKYLGQTVVVENKAGAGGTLGATAMVTAKPDGYTVTQIPITVFRIPHTTKVGFDPLTDLTYLIGISGYTFGVAVRADAPWKTWEELVDYAKANPGKLSYGTPGANTSLHITMEEIAYRYGIKWTHVPFRGNADNMQALLGGHVDAAADATGWGAARRCGQDAAARDLGRQAHEALARRADAEGARLRHRVDVAVRHRRAEGDGPGGRRRCCTTRSRRAWRTPSTCRRWRSTTRTSSTSRARTTRSSRARCSPTRRRR